jgi:hypothetical protein
VTPAIYANQTINQSCNNTTIPQKRNRQVPHPMSKRWIPYKHSNGIAIYYHQNITEGADFVGGEYMVSSIVRGTPEQCLAALTHRSSTTTILGPATAVEVLSRDGNAQVNMDAYIQFVGRDGLEEFFCLVCVQQSIHYLLLSGPWLLFH